jgi:glycosyltransferase involved in cell wall biosynthesis
VKRIPFQRLVSGPSPTPERIFHTNLWFGGHNNPRYAELLPRLRRLDHYLIPVPERRLPRAAIYRLLRGTRYLRDPLLFTAASRRYRSCFATDLEHIRRFNGPVVADVDDPNFTPRGIELMRTPNLVAFVVTAARAGERLQALGVSAPFHVIPQGVSLAGISNEDVTRVRADRRRNGKLVVGYMAAWLLSSGDRDGDNPLYNVDHLLDLWDEIHERAPQARLWLIGAASATVRRRCEGRDDIAVLGRLPRSEMLAHVANFDIALYPRTKDMGIQAAKVAEYMGAGVPTVSYDYEVVDDLRATGAGVLVRTPREFVDAVVQLAQTPEFRTRVAEAARRAGAERDWDVLARRYEDEILDRYFPPDSAS